MSERTAIDLLNELAELVRAPHMPSLFAPAGNPLTDPGSDYIKLANAVLKAQAKHPATPPAEGPVVWVGRREEHDGEGLYVFPAELHDGRWTLDGDLGIEITGIVDDDFLAPGECRRFVLQPAKEETK